MHKILFFPNFQEASLFVFDKRSVEKLYKPKRKDQVEKSPSVTDANKNRLC